MRAAAVPLLAFLLIPVATAAAGPAQEARAELLGHLTQQEILDALPEWQDKMVAYEARYDVVAALKDFSEFVQIEVYLGSWCSDSAARVPEFFQVLNIVNSPRFQVSYTGVPEDPNARAPYIAGKEIEKIPTFIVLVNGLEKGRIVETPTASVEEDLLALLRR
jgi:hypothetical protein